MISIKNLYKDLADVSSIENKNLAYTLLMVLTAGILLQILIQIHIIIINEEFWAPLPVMLLELLVEFSLEIFSIITLLYLYFKKYDFRLQLPFAINSSAIALLLLTILFEAAFFDIIKINSFLYLPYILLILKLASLFYSIFLAHKIRNNIK
ncbi:hypothetical protein J4460_02600 [Candidatus Woesearchaeota archaeon]|nr:MAG: hypothetical protein QS99_C0005G0019 [archaeon GW2011_AR4]MBS3129540.1 hypothetical protein [Candidatus Woesearchaeota archaeon]HIH37508.1 hypothetical protein [Candidatus Woesearchaeota archaeon]HIH49743.1 hypothetical protein [Candidatus Woesearchaeota archaeon]HIJ03237.1 hypothetical protein [Candidatus Woesearchaeota archaeon]